MPDQNISSLLYRHVNMHQRHKHNDYFLRSKKVGRKITRRCRFGFLCSVTEISNMRDVATSIAGRKQLKHKSRLYDLPQTNNEVDINNYNPILLSIWEENMSLYEFVQWYDISKIKPRNKNIEYYKIDNGNYLKRRQRGYLINHYKYNVNHKNLRNECDTYAESFHKVKLHLVEALQYHEGLEELQKAFETAKELSQDDPENLIGAQNIKDDEAMQDLIFNKVIHTIDSNKLVLRLDVSGEGGPGKSFLIKIIKSAPTGTAAFNIDGLTVHRLLQLPVEHNHAPKYKQLFDYVLKVLRTDLKDVMLFVIDETTLFDYDELTINMRQQGDNFYRELLSRISIDLLIKFDCKIFENRKIFFKGNSFVSRLNELYKQLGFQNKQLKLEQKL
ncbi:hypothetical protein ACFW04_014426 [Cataglyphis niger]